MEEKTQPTPEQLLEEKKAKFAANPNAFVALDDLVLGAIKSPTGILICVGQATRSQVEVALSRLQFRAFQTFISMDIAMQEEQAKIVVPGGNGKKHGILGFVRGKR